MERSYKYQDQLHTQGYEEIRSLTFGNGFAWRRDNPKDFEDYMPDSDNSWDWRRAIKKYLEEKNIPAIFNFKDYKIVKAVGYHKDLWLFVYEVWVKRLKEG